MPYSGPQPTNPLAGKTVHETMTSAQSQIRSGFKLNTVQSVPAVGLGTFQGDAGNSTVKNTVLAALRSGYRHIDGATAYGNEKEIGLAIIESGIKRAEIFVTTKLSQTWHEPQDVEEALQQSLLALQLDYVDLYLMHFPYAYRHGKDHSTMRHPSGNGKPVIDYRLSRGYTEVWRAMEKCVDSGKARAIGLSNFNILKTKRVLEVATIRPAVNQVELHPYLPQKELLEFCKSESIHLMAHQPLGGKPVAAVNPNASHPGPLVDPQIVRIATAYGKSTAQVILSWAVQRGTSVIPKTIHQDRLEENLDLFQLRDQDFEEIENLADVKGSVRYLDPSGHVGFDVFSEECDEPVGDAAPWDT